MSDRLDDKVRAALTELVRLKDMKEWIESGKAPGEIRAQYEAEKEPAWEAARLALECAPSAEKRTEEVTVTEQTVCERIYRAMRAVAPSHGQRSDLSNERLCQWADKHDIDGTVIDIRAAVTDALETFAPSATPSITDAARKALRRYIWQVQHPAAPIAGTSSLDAAMVELRDAFMAAGEPDFNDCSESTSKGGEHG